MIHDPNPRRDLNVPVGPLDHVVGAQQASVTVVEYGDFECPICKRAEPAVKMLLSQLKDGLRFAFRHFPLEDAHPHALLAAEAAECAGAQGRFWEMHDLLFDNQSQLERQHLDRYAERLGLDMALYEAEMDGHAHLQRVRDDIDSAKRSGMRTTPGFFINGRLHDVSFDLHSLIEAARAALRNE